MAPTEPDDDNHANPDNHDDKSDSMITESHDDALDSASDTYEKSHMSQQDVDDYNKK